MARLYLFWFGLAATATVMASCGADNEDAGRRDGTAGEAAGAGMAGGSPTGGSNGGGTGGAAGTGGAVVPDPPGPGVTCGETTCADGSEVCCVSGPDRWCDANQCMGAMARLECDDAVDCPAAACCYTNIMESNWVTTLCSAECDMWDGVQVCKGASDCANDEPCHVFVCGALDASSRTVEIGLCTAIPPHNCE